MQKKLEKCTLCPHKCGIDRTKGKIGRCKSTDKVKIALYSTHEFEEPCISGIHGSGTVFFSNCNLNCIYCQNYEISQMSRGKEISTNELADIFLKQQEKNVENVNLVTPTSYVHQIIEAIQIARKHGFKLPIVYNTNAYENIDTIKSLDGYVDIYLPDLKYAENELAKKYSKIDNYFEVATEAIKEMYKQVGNPILNSNGIMQKGIMVRHLVLPTYIENSKKVLDWVKNNLSSEVYISIMAQYFPTYMAKNDKRINRKLTKFEWNKIIDYIDVLGIKNGFVQELGEHEEEYVPNWKY